MQVGNTELPFSAVTLAIVFISIYYLISNWNGSGSRGSNVFCEASHILISDHSEAGKKTLLEYQAKIQSDAALFAKHAQKFSSCASKNNGGNLVSCVPLLLACIGLHRC
jgi:PPIC-type PPIASE domain